MKFRIAGLAEMVKYRRQSRPCLVARKKIIAKYPGGRRKCAGGSVARNYRERVSEWASERASERARVLARSLASKNAIWRGEFSQCVQRSGAIVARYRRISRGIADREREREGGGVGGG
jgi:hypothetical protein